MGDKFSRHNLDASHQPEVALSLDHVSVYVDKDTVILTNIDDSKWNVPVHGAVDRSDHALNPSIKSTYTIDGARVWISATLKEQIKQYLRSKFGKESEKFDESTIFYGAERVHKYLPGAKFAAHVDVPKYSGHFANLLLLWYSEDARGGHLIVQNDVKIDDNSPRGVWLIYYIPLFTKHQVTELISGVKYTVVIPLREAYSNSPRRLVTPRRKEQHFFG